MAKKKTTKKAPTKQCPKCNAKVHARKLACGCGHKFAAKKSTPVRKRFAHATANASSLTVALKAERKALQQRLSKIDELLETYQ